MSKQHSLSPTRGVQLGHKQVECDLEVEESSHNDEDTSLNYSPNAGTGTIRKWEPGLARPGIGK